MPLVDGQMHLGACFMRDCIVAEKRKGTQSVATTGTGSDTVALREAYRMLTEVAVRVSDVTFDVIAAKL